MAMATKEKKLKARLRASRRIPVFAAISALVIAMTAATSSQASWTLSETRVRDFFSFDRENHREQPDLTPQTHRGKQRISTAKASGRTSFHKDHLGSTTVVTDEDGNIPLNEPALVQYRPYGELKAGFSLNTVTNYNFTDQELDRSTGLYNYDARLYNPEVGMFLTADRILPEKYDPQQLNRYAYARNNPVKYIDPNGKAVETPWDVFSLVTSAIEFAADVGRGDVGAALVSGTAVVLDTAAAMLPGVPGGAGVALKAARQGEKLLAEHGDDVVRGTERGIASLGERAKEIHKAVSPATQRRTTIAVTETAEGTRVVTSSEKRLRPAQRELLKEGEVEGVGTGHAETTGLESAREMGLTPTSVGASRPICPNCASELNAAGVKPETPFKEPHEWDIVSEWTD